MKFFTLLVALLSGLSGCAAIEINPGRAHGNITFEQTSAEVAAHLAANPTVPNSSTIPEYKPVKFYDNTSATLAATSEYALVNTAPDANSYIAASYDIRANVADAGSAFLVSIDSMLFSDDSAYRFGSLQSGSASSQTCTGVLPESVNPAGTQCNVSECAALLNLEYRFVGAAADLAALDNDPVTCRVEVYLEDPPGSGTRTRQANTGSLTHSLDTMLGTGGAGPALTSLLVRENAASVEIVIGCSAQVRPGENGFVIFPASGRTPFAAEATLPSLACGASVTPPVIDIHVERTAGRLEGYFDISDHDEVSARLSLDRTWSAFSLSPPLVSAGSQPTEKWVFEGAPQGLHSVIVQTLLNDGEQILVLPYKDGLNGQVLVTQGATTDLGATFVTKPRSAQGRVKLFDPGGLTDLDAINTEPLQNYGGWNRSYVGAYGDPEKPVVINAGSGIGGESLGRLNGSYNTATHEADLNYELLLAGLNSEGGNLDGTNAKITSWDIDTLNVMVEPDIGSSMTNIQLGMSLRADTSSTDSISLPDQNICFGKTEFTLQVDPSLGTLYSPWISFSDYGDIDPGLVASSPIAEVYGHGNGIPIGYDSRANSATVAATLPEGFQYRGHTGVSLSPSDSVDESDISHLYLGYIQFPENGVIRCGSVNDECLTLSDSEGNYSQLSVNITDGTGLINPDYCLHDDSPELTISADSDGTNVNKLAYVVDPPATITEPGELKEYCLSSPMATVLCTSCGPDPSFPLSISTLPPGPHRLVACASDALACPAATSYQFNVEEQDLGLSCAEDFSVTVDPGEAEISKEDSRIADSLFATIVGNCGLSGTIIDDRPDLFTLGPRQVNFESTNVGTCSTTVTLEEPPEYLLAFRYEDDAILEHIISVYDVADSSAPPPQSLYTHANPYHFEYAANGDRVAVIPDGDTGAIKIINSESGGAIATHAIPSGYKLYDVDFNPQDPSKYAIVGSETDEAGQDPDQHVIFIYNNGVELSRLEMWLLHPENHITRPKISWSQDASRLAATFNIPIPQINLTAICTVEYQIVSDQLVLPEPLYTGMICFPRQGIQHRRGIRETVYQNADWLAVANDISVLRTLAHGSSRFMLPIAGAINNDFDFTTDGKAAAYISSLPRGPGLPDLISGYTALDQDPSPVYHSGPALWNASSIAISSDAKYVAVAAQVPVAGTGGTLAYENKIYVYTFPEFELVKEIDVSNKPRNLEFKPLD